MNYAISRRRWICKKLARRMVAALGGLAIAIRSQGSAKPTIRVLTYHRFTSETLDPVSVKPSDFEQQLRWLKNNVDLLDANAFDEVLSGRRILNRDAVLVTVDDGHRSFYEHAYPLLKAHGVPAVLFVCPAFVKDPPNQHDEFMSWDQLSEVARNGIPVASHGFSHRSLTKLSIDEARQEIQDAKRALERRLDANEAYFSFPFGTARDHSPELADVLTAQGYKYSFTAQHGRCASNQTTHRLPRLKIESGESVTFFAGIVRGHLDLWSLVDAILWPLQQRGRL